MTAQSLRRWGWVHKWTSLVCTLFMLLLCLTGLPLIFSHEIDELSGEHFTPTQPTPGSRWATADSVAAAAQALYPKLVPLYLFSEKDEPGLWYAKLDTRTNTDERDAVLVAVDGGSGRVLGAPNFGQGFMHLMYRLHVDLFAGIFGKLFLGAMGILLVVSLVSGVVLYAPFMQRLNFGTVRRERNKRIFWLDQHNLLGIVTVTWALAVGGTGVINTWADLILKAWQAEQMMMLSSGQTRVRSPGDAARREEGIGAQQAIDRALGAAPGMQLSMLAWPGTLLSTPDHFAVILRGDTPLTARLTQALLVSPRTGEVLEASARPWYVTIFQLSQPLHFGDYGGLPLKIFWALLDLITIVVLGSGLYLWLARGTRHQPYLAEASK